MENVTPKKVPKTLRNYLSIGSVLVSIIIPTVSRVYTNNYKSDYVLEETTYYWPWMVLTHKIPPSIYFADQWYISGFPWTLLLFLPTLYMYKYCLNLYNSSERFQFNTLMIATMAFFQIIVIYVMSKSQQQYVLEDVHLYFIPQLIIMAVNGYLSWDDFYSNYQKKLETAKNKKLTKLD